MKKDRKAELLKQLKITPVVEVACRKVGVGRATFYRWKKEDQKFADKAEYALQEGSHLVNDMAESKLISAIKDGNMTGIIFWLKNHQDSTHQNLKSQQKVQTYRLQMSRKS